MPDTSALFPQPPQQNQQQNSLLNNPGQAVNLMQGLQELAIRRQQAPALGQQPTIQNQQTQMSTRGMDLEQARVYGSTAAGVFSGMVAGKAARGEKITDDDLHDAYVQSAANLKSGHVVFPQVLDTMYDSARHSKDRAAYILNLQNSAQPPATLSQERTGTPGRYGESNVTTAAGANVPGQRQVGMASGEAEYYKSMADNGREMSLSAVPNIMAESSLGAMKEYSDIMGKVANPSEGEKNLNRTAQRLGLAGITLTPKQLAAAEGFTKVANDMSSRQAAAIGASTNAGREMLLHATPGAEQSQEGREHMINFVAGNTDFYNATRQLWQKMRAKGYPAASYGDFLNDVSGDSGKIPGLSARVFQFNRMTPEGRQDMLNSMPRERFEKFEKQYQYAIDQGLVPALPSKK